MFSPAPPELQQVLQRCPSSVLLILSLLTPVYHPHFPCPSELQQVLRRHQGQAVEALRFVHSLYTLFSPALLSCSKFSDGTKVKYSFDVAREELKVAGWYFFVTLFPCS